MGLDITAVSRAVFIKAVTWEEYEDEYELQDGDEVEAIYKNVDFPGREAPWELPDEGLGVFRIEGERFGFRAGSYGGYNMWREELCYMANRCEPAYIWNNRDLLSVRQTPFYELIDFADNEGVIGPTAALNLWKDFTRYALQAEKKDPMFLQTYNNFYKACRLAAVSGFIEFH